MKKAHLELLKLDQFRRRLQAEQGMVTVLLDTPAPSGEQAVTPDTVTGDVAATLFDKHYQTFPYHLIFRAFNGQIEYAWWLTQGVVVSLGDDGSFDVENPSALFYYRKGMQARVQYVVLNARRIYQKMAEVLDSED